MKNTLLILVLVIAHFNIMAQQAEDYKLSFEPHIFKSQKGQEVKAELGTFTVFEKRGDPSSRKIQLSFVRFKSTSTNPGSPIVYLAGGPGGSGISAAKGERFDLFMALREFGDVIAFDQRGTGQSGRLERCAPIMQIPIDKPADHYQIVEVIKENARHCIAEWKESGVDITAYNNIESAADIDDLRKALGSKKITLWGISYGSQLALTYVRQFEKKVDKLILAGLEAPGDNIKRPIYVTNFLNNIDAAVKQQPEAVKLFPDLPRLMKEVLDQLEKQPVIATIKDRKGKTVEVGIGKTDVQLITGYFLLKNPSNIKSLPYMFHEMKKGNFQEMAQMAYKIKSFASMVDGMPFLMDGMTGVTEEMMIKVELESKECLLGRMHNFPFPDVTYGLELPDLGDDYREDVKSKAKGLFISGTMDGRTFIEDAKRIVGKFPKVTHVIVENGGHDIFEQSPKIQELIVSYLRKENVSTSISLEPILFITN
jgi:pimeloyl-ACP methyl ester carboxylesterase